MLIAQKNKARLNFNTMRPDVNTLLMKLIAGTFFSTLEELDVGSTAEDPWIHGVETPGEPPVADF